jgi:hypothetical protein
MRPHQIPTIADVLRQNAIDIPRLKIVPEFAKFSIPHVKHKQVQELLPIWFDFLDISDLTNTTLTYEIHANEIIEPVCGKLHLRIDENYH